MTKETGSEPVSFATREGEKENGMDSQSLLFVFIVLGSALGFCSGWITTKVIWDSEDLGLSWAVPLSLAVSFGGVLAVTDGAVIGILVACAVFALAKWFVSRRADYVMSQSSSSGPGPSEKDEKMFCAIGGFFGWVVCTVQAAFLYANWGVAGGLLSLTAGTLFAPLVMDGLLLSLGFGVACLDTAFRKLGEQLTGLGAKISAMINRTEHRGNPEQSDDL